MVLNMKYNKLDLNEKLFGDDFIVYDWKEDDKKIEIYVKATAHKDICLVCGFPVSDLHNTYHRRIQTYPIRSKCTYLDVIAYKYDCTNDECDRKVIMQNLPFVTPSQRRTDELNCLILAVSMFLSNEGASKVLKLLGVVISNDSIKRLLDKILIEDNPSVEQIGIDDVAIRKGQTYSTAIYDMKDHHLIALLDGRDKNIVKEWLKNHKKIKIATRDRASAYASALNEVIPECIQIADRFHLLQNLIDRMKDIFKQELPEMIFIRDSQIMDEEPKKADVLKIDLDYDGLNELHYDNSEPADENGIIIKFDKSFSDKSNKQHKENAESRKKTTVDKENTTAME